MISGKSFHTTDGTSLSSEKFLIHEGLQQGTVNFLILFNIFTSDLHRLFNLNQPQNPNLLIFADDAIVYTASNKVSEVQSTLDSIVNKINSYYASWNLKLNPTKYETILFRKPLEPLSTINRKGYKNFQLKTNIPGSNTLMTIPHKNNVRYLGYQLDYLLRNNTHIDFQLKIARTALQANSRIFYSSHLTPKTKTILYQLLIRPVIRPIWWNCNHPTMEKIQVFESRCLRACLRMYRSHQSNFRRHINNSTIYNEANISRIDTFLIKLIRNYFSKLPTVQNNILQPLAKIDPAFARRQLSIGYVSPQSFMYCDDKGFIQDANNTPIIYHWRRNRADKRIAVNMPDAGSYQNFLRYSLALPRIDKDDFSRTNYKKYWWLSTNSVHIATLEDRKRQSLRTISSIRANRRNLRHPLRS